LDPRKALVPIALLVAACAGDGGDGAWAGKVLGPTALDPHGGIADLPAGGASARFRVATVAGRRMLVTPSGNGFLALGVGGLDFDGDEAPALGDPAWDITYSPAGASNACWWGDDEAGRAEWLDHAVATARSAGFNLIAAATPEAGEALASRPGPVAPWIVALDVARTVASARGGGGFPDTADPGFADAVGAAVGAAVKDAFRQDPFLVGYVTDASLDWPEAARDPAGAAEAAKAARRYFDTVAAAIRAADPDRMVFSAPIPADAPEALASAAGACDVPVVRAGAADASRVAALATTAGGGGEPKPVLIVAPIAGASDSGLPNKGASSAVATQAERAADYGRTVEALLAAEAVGVRVVTGFLWERFTDDPPAGGPAGTSRNCGLVAVDGTPYLTLIDGLGAANALAADRLLGGDAPALAAPAGLAATGAWPVTVAWEPVDGATSYEVVVASSPSMRGVLAREEWGGAKTDGPHDVRMTVTRSSVAVDHPLAAGTWRFAVRALRPGEALPSPYAGPVAFEAAPACPQAHGTEAEVGCFELPEPAPDPAAADGGVTVGTVWYDSLESYVADLAFVANSLGEGHPRNGGKGVEIRVVREWAVPLTGSATADRFCPSPVLDAYGNETNAAAFLHVRHVGQDGKVVADRVLDPGGNVKPFSCAKLDGSGEPVARKEYYVLTSDERLPLDVRLDVQIH